MKKLNWKDDLLLREMELFAARDRQATGPRAPLPDPGVSTDVASLMQSEIRTLYTALSAAKWGAEYQRKLRDHALVNLQKARYGEARNHRLFMFGCAGAGVWFLVSVGLALKIAGWL